MNTNNWSGREEKKTSYGGVTLLTGLLIYSSLFLMTVMEHNDIYTNITLASKLNKKTWHIYYILGLCKY